MECFSRFQHHEFKNFKKKIASFLTFTVIIPVPQPNTKSPLGFDNKLLENVFNYDWFSTFWTVFNPFL